MRLKNIHNATLRAAEDFFAATLHSMPRSSESFDGREYHVVRGQLKDGGGSFAIQSLRYPGDQWSEVEAKQHSESHDATELELALDEPAAGAPANGVDASAVLAAAAALEEHDAQATMPLGTLAPHQFWSMEPSALDDMLGQFNEYIAANGITAPDGASRVARRMVINGAEIVDIRGPLSKRMSLFSFLFGGTSTDDLRRQIRSAANDPEISSIVMRIDSPGGNMIGMQELADEIFAARQKKPVLGQVDGIMASAALMAGSQATKLFANASDLVGGIGVIKVVTDTSEQAQAEGRRIITVDTGPLKGAETPGTVVTDTHIEHFQHIVDAFMTQFLTVVERGRGMDMAKLRGLSDGGIFTAQEALDNGLIDGIQNTENTVAQAIAQSGAPVMGAKHNKRNRHLGMSIEDIRAELEKLSDIA